MRSRETEPNLTDCEYWDQPLASVRLQLIEERQLFFDLSFDVTKIVRAYYIRIDKDDLVWGEIDLLTAMQFG